MIKRREFIASGILFLAGCSQTRSSSSPTDTATKNTDSRQTRDFSLPDLRIGNSRSRPVVVSVEFQPEGKSESTLSMTLTVPSEEKILWNDSKIFDESGQVRANLLNEDIEPAEASWNGDNESNNRGIEIDIDLDELEVMTLVA